MYVCTRCTYTYVYTRRQWRNGVNGQWATYQLGNQWYRLPARSNVRHAVDGAVEGIVAWMSANKRFRMFESARACDPLFDLPFERIALSSRTFVYYIYYIYISFIVT